MDRTRLRALIHRARRDALHIRFLDHGGERSAVRRGTQSPNLNSTHFWHITFSLPPISRPPAAMGNGDNLYLRRWADQISRSAHADTRCPTSSRYKSKIEAPLAAASGRRPVGAMAEYVWSDRHRVRLTWASCCKFDIAYQLVPSLRIPWFFRSTELPTSAECVT